jgi:8-oxo-dGTP diphosphatase
MITCSFESGETGKLRHVVTDNIVLNGGNILLIKRSGRLIEGGKWGLVGGFVERDETIKQGAVREIMEETGYEVTGLTLLRIIDTPTRPSEDRQNVSFVHFCTAQNKIKEGDRESDEVRWFPLQSLPEQKLIAFDHYSSICLYLDYLNSHFSLPALG